MKDDVLSEVAWDLVTAAGALAGADELVSADELELVCPDCARAVRAGEMMVTRRDLAEAMNGDDPKRTAGNPISTIGEVYDRYGIMEVWSDLLTDSRVLSKARDRHVFGDDAVARDFRGARLAWVVDLSLRERGGGFTLKIVVKSENDDLSETETFSGVASLSGGDTPGDAASKVDQILKREIR